MNAAPGFGQMTDASARTGGLDVDDYMTGMPFDERAMAYPSTQPHSGGFGFNDGYVEPDDGEDGEGRMQAEVFTCAACSRAFVRLCDLNKHSKTHSRPFKCPHVGCKYHELGWPTEKELERHDNDKHAPQPNTFACYYQPCSYTSKRESNLKQHMEKSHGWNYIRSRSTKTYRCPIPGCSDCTNPDDSRQRHDAFRPVTPARTNSQPPFNDFVLYPDSHAAAMGTAPQHQGAYVNESGDPWDMRDSYVPWSPPTRGESLSKFLSSVDSTMGGHVPVDPRLTQTQYPNVIQELADQNLAAGNHLLVQQSAIAANLKLSSSPPIYALRPAADVWPSHKMTKDGNPSGTRAAGQTGYNTRGGGTPAAGAAPITPLSGPRRSTAPKLDESDGDEEEEGEESGDDERPRKRGRFTTEEDFDDSQMPCPFRKHDPVYFDRNNKEKFSPCHTKHKDVSTIVRHLGRPAHCLFTDERCVSSFDVEELDDELPRPRAGLCKRCWGIFRNRDDFDHHRAMNCSKVSRGKREKFWLLYEAFCNEPEPQREARRPTQASVPPAANEGTSLAAPVTPAGPRESVGASLPPVKVEEESIDLAERVTTLENRCKDLETTNGVLVNTVRKLQSSYRALYQFVKAGPSAGQSTAAFLASIPAGIPAALKSKMEGGADDARDRESVVAGMDSGQLKDVDHGDFLSDAQRTLSGFSSTSSKSSSVRHVPPSSKFQGGDGRKPDGSLRTPPKTATSNEDSGYGGGSINDNTGGNSAKATALATVMEQGVEDRQQQQPSQQGAPVSEAPVDFDFSEAGREDFDSVWDDRV